VHIAESADPTWVRRLRELEGRATDAEAEERTRRIMAAAPALYARLPSADGGTAAVGRLAVLGEWAGLYCLAVHPALRRTGLGTAVVGALLRHGARLGARRTWLQVEADNVPALSLYERLGYRTASRYHYRVLEDGPAG
jgi:N-acetylglutamate synthase